jgi:hypothetical protein
MSPDVLPSNQIQGRCRLCNTQGPLVDSHIIPNFQYKPLKKAEGHYLVLSTNPEKKPIKKQKGITEYLLCAKCDNERLSRYEDHLAKLLFRHPPGSKQTGPLLVVTGYDYKKLKNALLSILWRMSVSSDPYFTEVDLGTKHEERLRLALLNDTEFQEEEYSILLTAPLFKEQQLGAWTLPPDFTRSEGNRVYRCLISGLLFTFIVGSAPITSLTRPFILRRMSWPIVMGKVEKIPFLLDACLQLGRANALKQNA